MSEMKAMGDVVLGFAMGAMSAFALVFIVITFVRSPRPPARGFEDEKKGGAS